MQGASFGNFTVGINRELIAVGFPRADVVLLFTVVLLLVSLCFVWWFLFVVVLFYLFVFCVMIL